MSAPEGSMNVLAYLYNVHVHPIHLQPFAFIEEIDFSLRGTQTPVVEKDKMIKVSDVTLYYTLYIYALYMIHYTDVTCQGNVFK